MLTKVTIFRQKRVAQNVFPTGENEAKYSATLKCKLKWGKLSSTFTVNDHHMGVGKNNYDTNDPLHRK